VTAQRWLLWPAIGLLVFAWTCATRPQSAIAKAHDIPLAGAYVRGPRDAPVTIVEFSDFECPYCVKATSLVAQVLRAYPRDVKFVYKNFPLPMHPNAGPAARAALAAGLQGKFWEMHDQLFAHSGDLSGTTMRRIAKTLGLDLARFEADMNSPAVRDQVDLEVRQGKVVGVRGTPTFFVNGRIVERQSLAGFKALIDDALGTKAG
jgi:protein-disulfide isomerase